MAQYHLSDILSVVTGTLVSTRNMNGVFDILNYITGDTIYTYQLPEAIVACRAYILSQHPQLEKVGAGIDSDDEEFVKAWLREQISEFGESLEILPMLDSTDVNFDI